MTKLHHVVGDSSTETALYDQLEQFSAVVRAARSLIDRRDFWDNATGVPGEYDDLFDALKELDR